MDVVCGHCWIIDPEDRPLRRAWSEPFSAYLALIAAAVKIQPSTFIRREAFLRTGGFNIENKCSWDGELLVDLYLSGAKIMVIDEFLSQYRLHEVSITNSGALSDLMAKSSRVRFERLMRREWKAGDPEIALLLRVFKHLRNPEAFLERLLRGPIFRRGVK